jgi:hypothetical protein
MLEEQEARDEARFGRSLRSADIRRVGAQMKKMRLTTASTTAERVGETQSPSEGTAARGTPRRS